MNNRAPFPLVLFGAGASAPAGVPTAVEMTRAMVKLCQQDRSSRSDYFQALRAIIGALMMGYRCDELDFSVELPDVEQVMNATSLLGDRFALEFAPFVAAWHPIIEDLERRSLDYSITSELGGSEVVVGGELQDTLAQLCDNLLQRPDGALFRSLTAYLKGKLIELTWLRAADKLAYLDPLLAAARLAPITVTSLNYDNALELRAASLGVPCETGISEWSRTGALPSVVTGIDLIKLHGSIKWWWTEPTEDSGLGLSYRALTEVNDELLRKFIEPRYRDDHGPHLGVIFGGRNKLTAAGPFLDLLAKFKTLLEQHTNLLVIGYSFRDPHVNQCVVRWLHRDVTRRVTIVDRLPASQTDNPFYQAHTRNLGERLTFEPIGTEEGIATHFGNRDSDHRN